MSLPAPSRRRQTGRSESVTQAPAASGATRRSTRARAAPPVLVRQVRNGIDESIHRGDLVEADASGRVIRLLGDPDRIVTLRSSAKPFGVVPLLEAGGIAAFELTFAEIAIMAGSHSGEDVHVRTVQSVLRRAGISQSLLATGTTGMPLDELTAARLARDGERPSEIRHMCSGQHAAFLLLSRLRGWDPAGYWHDEHPSQVAYRDAMARAFGTSVTGLRTAIDGCGVATFAFPLREVARAYAMLADPSAVPASDGRSSLAQPLTTIRDAMLRHPEMVAGARARLDTALMTALRGRLVSKSGAEGLRGLALLAGPRANGGEAGASGMAIKIEDGDGYDRAGWAATVEAVRQAGLLHGEPLAALGRYHRPPVSDPHGRPAAEAVADFLLAPVGELIG